MLNFADRILKKEASLEIFQFLVYISLIIFKYFSIIVSILNTNVNLKHRRINKKFNKPSKLSSTLNDEYLILYQNRFQ